MAWGAAVEGPARASWGGCWGAFLLGERWGGVLDGEGGRDGGIWATRVAWAWADDDGTRAGRAEWVTDSCVITETLSVNHTLPPEAAHRDAFARAPQILIIRCLGEGSSAPCCVLSAPGGR